MSISRKVLVEKLEFVALAANPGSFVPEFQNIHFSGETLFASDGVITIDTDSPLPDHTFSVRSDTFLNLLSNVESEEISLDIKTKNLIVRTEKVEGKFRIEKPGKFNPSAPKEEKDIHPELLDALHLCRFGASREKTSGVYSGVRIEGSKVFSTDRFRVFYFDLGISTGISPCTVPTKFLEIICRKKDDITHCGILENGQFYVVLEDGTRVSTNAVPGEFPPVDQYFVGLDKSEFCKLDFESDLKKILEKHLRSLLDGVEFYDREISFSVEGNNCKLFSESKESGCLEENVTLKESVGKFEFIVNPTLLYELLTHKDGKFLYNLEQKLILVDAGRLQVLIQPKV